MKTKVQKWGNSLAVRIPNAFAAEARIAENSPVDMSIQSGKLVIEADRTTVPTLKELLGGVTEENLHPETDWGSPVGNEVW